MAARQPAKKPTRKKPTPKAKPKPRAKPKAKPAAKKMGRLTAFTSVKGNKVCELISKGHSLRAIEKMDKQPTATTVRNWLRSQPDFLTQYTCAREEQADFYADQIIQIADDSDKDIIMTDDGPKVDHDHINRDKVRIDARKWLAGKLKPSIYGARLQLDHTIKFESMSNQELLKRFEQLAKNLGMTMPEHYRIEKEKS